MTLHVGRGTVALHVTSDREQWSAKKKMYAAILLLHKIGELPPLPVGSAQQPLPMVAEHTWTDAGNRSSYLTASP